MNKFLIISILLACLAAFAAASVKPESRLYFSFPLAPAAAPAATTAAAAATTAAASGEETTTAAASGEETTTAAASDDATTAASDEATTAAPAGPVLKIVPLFEAIGMLFTAVANFLGNLFGSLFG